MAKRKNKKAEFVLWMSPILDALRELGDSGSPQEVSDLIAKNLNIPDEKKEELTDSGVPRFHNQVCWARQYLVWEGFLSSAKRGLWTLTEKGRTGQITENQGRDIFRKWVALHAAAREAKKFDQKRANIPEIQDDDIKADRDDTPHREELLNLLKSLSPRGFENLCKYILRVFGFENVVVTPKGKDDGIDGYGVLQINPFVSFKVIFQCKRYQGTVSRAQVGDLRNAMIGRADKGIMMTTGIFSEEAKREASRDGAPPIELIDGEALLNMIEQEEIGLKTKTIFEIDYSFFEPYMPKEKVEQRDEV
jgi:restriction system protein